MKANLYRPSAGPRTELLGLAAVLAWYGPYDAHETNSIAKARVAMLEDRALRFRIRVCARIFRPRQLLMKTAPGTQAQILASGSGNQLDLSLIRSQASATDSCRSSRAPVEGLQLPQMNLLRQSSKARTSRHQPTKYEVKAVQWATRISSKSESHESLFQT